MSKGALIGLLVIMTSVAGVAIALYIAGRQSMRQATLDARPIIVNNPPDQLIVPITEIVQPIPPPVPPAAVPA